LGKGSQGVVGNMPSRERIVDALREHKRVDAAAESLGLGVRRMYRWMERYGLTLKGVLWRSSVSALGSGDETAPAASKAEPQQLGFPADKLTPEKLKELGIMPEQFAHKQTCHSLGCGTCGQVEQRIRDFERTLKHRRYNCPCGKDHVGRGSAQTPVRRPDNKLAMSYAPRRPPWER
jgi:hypothetical protein